MVSVIIPSYKRELEKLQRAVESVLHQENVPCGVEIVVVDDNLAENEFSADMMAYCESKAHVRYIRHFGNRGDCAARNLGVANARGEVIGFLDDDDEWLPNFISTLLAHLNDDVKLVTCCGWTVDPDGIKKPYPLHYVDAPITFNGLLAEDTMQSIAFLMDKRVFWEVGGFDENMRSENDYHFRLAVAMKYPVKMLPDKLFLYYLHAGAHISKDDRKKLESAIRMYHTYKQYYRKNAKAYANIWFNIWQRRHNLKQHIRAFGAICRFSSRRPQYIARAVLVATKSKRLRQFLDKMRHHSTDQA